MDIHRNQEEALAGRVSAGEQDPSAQGKWKIAAIWLFNAIYRTTSSHY